MSGSESFGHGLKVNFGFAGAGDAVKQGDGKTASGFGTKDIRGILLFGGQVDFGKVYVGKGEVALDFDQFGDENAGVNQGFYDRLADFGAAADFGPGVRVMF